MSTALRRSRLLPLLVTAVLLAAALVSGQSARADVTFVVDNVTDDAARSACTAAPDDCSLRGAVASANATAGTDTIEFAIPSAQCPSGVCPITITNGPLEISEALTIDATTQPQNSGPSANVCATDSAPSHMRVELLADPGGGLDGQVFHITHATGSSTIRGFAFGDNDGSFLSAAIYATNGTGHQIACNHFALNAAGDSHLGTSDFWAGILMEDPAGGVVIGTNGDGVDDVSERNVFASGGYSIYINNNSNNTIAGNYFGFTADGATHIDAGTVLIRQGSSNNIVGTNEDGTSDELERNYFGNDVGAAGLSLPATGGAVPVNELVVGNSFGLSPAGASVSLSRSIDISSLDADETGWEIRENTFVGAGSAIAVSGDETGASVLIADNVFGIGPGGVAMPINDAIWLHDLGSHVVRDNLISNSDSGLVVSDTASFAAGSTNNCVVNNTEGVDNVSGIEVNLENNWWGAIDGPSGIGSGSGDSINADVDFTPWLTNPPDQCNTAPTATDDTFTINAGADTGTSIGTVAASDDGTDLTFAIIAGDPGSVFAIDASSGEITMAGTPDYPTTTSYPLTVEVTDAGSLSDTATVTINLTNEVPAADDAAFVVSEDASAGTSLGTVAASDGDGDTLAYSITAGDLGGAFAIDSDGLVTVAGALDYETTSSYSLTVDVSDGFESDTATVAVTVTEVFEVPTTPTFDDVALDHTFFADIEWLADQGITRGCNPPDNTLYCPDASVTRGQMAAFLHRALGGVLTEGATPDFTDIDDSIFVADILWLGATGVTKGCNPPTNDLFCPDAVVTRGQMAAFLVRAMGYTAGAGSDRFSDDDGSVFEADIERLAEAGVTRGCNPPTDDLFCPDVAVTRAEMAAFLHRALG